MNLVYGNLMRDNYYYFELLSKDNDGCFLLWRKKFYIY
jgi:hypothetical protein